MQLSPQSEAGRARALRNALVDSIVANGDLQSPRVIAAMRSVPRHQFVAARSLERAYDDTPVPIGFDQTISQPTVVAMMTEALELTGGERVLEVGTGSGYQAAVLSRLARDVYSVERVSGLVTIAKANLASYANVHVREGDGFLGWPEEAPFDRILLTAAPDELPNALVEQLADGGILVAPVGDGGLFGQLLVRVRKQGSEISRESLGSVQFVPMLPGTTRAGS